MMVAHPKPGKLTDVARPDMVGPVLVVCPTKGRPDRALALRESFLATTTNATLLFIVDDHPDAQEGYEDALADHPRVYWTHPGGTGGPVQFAERATQVFRGPFRIYGMVPDDCVFKTPGWDTFIDKKFDMFPKRVGVISAWHNYGTVVNFPWVTREWIEAVGWYWYPNNFHYCCDTILEIIGECSNSIYYCTPDEFDIWHYHDESQNPDKMTRDLWGMFNFVVLERREFVNRVKKAQGLPFVPDPDYKPWEVEL